MFGCIEYLGIIVKPSSDRDKIWDKAWNGAFEDCIVADYDMLAKYLALIVLSDNWNKSELYVKIKAWSDPLSRVLVHRNFIHGFSWIVTRERDYFKGSYKLSVGIASLTRRKTIDIFNKKLITVLLIMGKSDQKKKVPPY